MTDIDFDELDEDEAPPRRKAHYARGRECHCDMKFSDDPAAYVAAHPSSGGLL